MERSQSGHRATARVLRSVLARVLHLGGRMILRYLPVNQAWCVTLTDAVDSPIVGIGVDNRRLFPSRASLVAALRECGLDVVGDVVR